MVYGAASNGSGAAYAVAQAAISELGRPITAAQMYSRLESAYYNNQTYSDIALMLSRALGDNAPDMIKSLQSPAFRVVEFYASHLWPGETLEDAFRFVDGPSAIENAVRQMWDWSNFGAKRQTIARRFAMLGNVFIKIAQSQDKQRVFMRLLDPRWVTRFLFDDQDRGYLIYARLDIPQHRFSAKGEDEDWTVTEIWDRDRDSFQRWEHTYGAEAKPEQMGTPMMEGSLVSLFGIDFIPIVHAPFRDDAAGLGLGAYQVQLSKIEEANVMAHELHAKLYRHNRPTHVVAANAVDRTGRAMPPPIIPGLGGVVGRVGQAFGRNGTQSTAPGSGAATTVQVGDETWIYLPGLATVTDLIPKINYADALAILVNYMDELAQDLPEMVYSRIYSMPGDASGVALRYRLMAAIDNAHGARANILPGLIRCGQIGITIGRNGRQFTGVQGDYADGKLKYGLKLLPVIPDTETERLEEDGKRAANAVVKDQAGWPKVLIFTEAGYSKAEAEQMVADREDENAAAVELAQKAFSSGDDVGDGFGGGSQDDGSGDSGTGQGGE